MKKIVLILIGLLFLSTKVLFSQEMDDNIKNIPEEGTLEYIRYLVSKSIGKKAPDFNLKALTSDSVNFADYSNKVILIKFWGLGCPPCMKSTKEMVKLDTMYPHNKFEVIGIIPAKLRPKSIKKTIKYLNDEGATFVNGIGSVELLRSFTESIGIPTFFLVDKDGIIKYTHVSDFKTIEEFELLKSNIDKLL